MRSPPTYRYNKRHVSSFADALKQFAERGWDAEVAFSRPDEIAVPTVETNSFLWHVRPITTFYYSRQPLSVRHVPARRTSAAETDQLCDRISSSAALSNPSLARRS